ncbi:hypothetical protein [Pseudomonas alcaligenes]|uniref:hypothetical protein n=1 Tax=Aquipseudomonas alcaligenes TaxID=43263 RepID=UPI00358E21A3
MSDTNTVKNWSYPFKTAGESSREITDPQVYFDALAKAENGFYPMGKNGLWHGGVHFDDNTATLLDQSSIRCIADGEVIAYRIDEHYPVSEYTSEIPLIKRAPFSTGFVLVKHRLELPPVPTATATTSTDGLTFYSLYMHLLDWKGYQTFGAPLPPPFLAETSYLVSDRCSDPVLGLRVRKDPKGGETEVLALLPKGCKVTLGEADTSDPRWRQLASIVEGTAIPPLPNGTIGWVYASELTDGYVADKAKDSEPGLTISHQGLNVRKEGKLAGAILGVLPRGAKVKLGAKSTIDPNYYKLLEVLDYKGVPALPNGPDGKPLGYVYLSELDVALDEPKAKNTVYPLPTPYSIKAGELIGHIGAYQNHDDSSPGPLLHLEVFSCEDVPAFIAKSRELASSLPTEQKTLLKIHQGASKLIPHREDISSTNPPKVTDEGVKIGVDLIIPINVLEKLPVERKIKVSETEPESETPRTIQWWRLDNLLADAAGNPISGWLAEQDLITTRHSPWEWEGFDFISETVSVADQFACQLDAQRLLSEAMQADYQAQISTADHGPVKTRLYDIIDGTDGSTRDNKLTTTEIRAALGKPWHAQSVSHLITHYESEWFWKDAKWDELDKLMDHTPTDQNLNWIREKERIQKLSWWGEMVGKYGISTDGMAWHFHPSGLVGTLIKGKKIKITIAMLKKVFEGLSNTDESDDLLGEISDQISENAEKYKLDTDLRLSHFFAQVRQEIGSKCRTVEDFTYSPEGLKNTFRYFRLHPSEAEDYGYEGNSKFVAQENQIAIANRAYSGKYHNGNIESGDGWRYRGRGLKHLTFKSNYSSFTEYHNRFWGEDVDFVNSPDLLYENHKYTVRSGVYFWLSHNLFSEADKGAADSVVDSITRIINEGTDSYGSRRGHFKRIFEDEKIFKDI